MQVIAENDEFRREVLYQPGVEAILAKRGCSIQGIFLKFASATFKKPKRKGGNVVAMMMKDWLRALESANLITEHFTRNQARECFCRSKMLAVNDTRMVKRLQCLVLTGAWCAAGSVRLQQGNGGSVFRLQRSDSSSGVCNDGSRPTGLG